MIDFGFTELNKILEEINRSSVIAEQISQDKRAG